MYENKLNLNSIPHEKFNQNSLFVVRYNCSQGECSIENDEVGKIEGNMDFVAKLCMLNQTCRSFQYDKVLRKGVLCETKEKKNEERPNLQHCKLQEGIFCFPY